MREDSGHLALSQGDSAPLRDLACQAVEWAKRSEVAVVTVISGDSQSAVKLSWKEKPLTEKSVPGVWACCPGQVQGSPFLLEEGGRWTDGQ